MKIPFCLALALIAVPAAARGGGGGGRGGGFRGAPAQSFRAPVATRAAFFWPRSNSHAIRMYTTYPGPSGFGRPGGFGRVGGFSRPPAFGSSRGFARPGSFADGFAGRQRIGDLGQGGAVLVGTQNLGTVYGPGGPIGSQTVEGGGFIRQAADAMDVGRARGIHWSPPDTPPSVPGTGQAGGGGATTNSTVIIENTTNSHSNNTNGN